MKMKEKFMRLLFSEEITRLEQETAISKTRCSSLERKLKEAAYKLDRTGWEHRNAFLNLSALPIEALRERCGKTSLYPSPTHGCNLNEECTAQKDAESPQNQWDVVTQYCSLGGCDMDIITMDSERDALILAIFLHNAGYRPTSNTACSECYHEYMKDCI